MRKTIYIQKIYILYKFHFNKKYSGDINYGGCLLLPGFFYAS